MTELNEEKNTMVNNYHEFDHHYDVIPVNFNPAETEAVGHLLNVLNEGEELLREFNGLFNHQYRGEVTDYSYQGATTSWAVEAERKKIDSLITHKLAHIDQLIEAITHFTNVKIIHELSAIDPSVTFTAQLSKDIFDRVVRVQNKLNQSIISLNHLHQKCVDIAHEIRDEYLAQLQAQFPQEGRKPDMPVYRPSALDFVKYGIKETFSGSKRSLGGMVRGLREHKGKVATMAASMIPSLSPQLVQNAIESDVAIVQNLDQSDPHQNFETHLNRAIVATMEDAKSVLDSLKELPALADALEEVVHSYREAFGVTFQPNGNAELHQSEESAPLMQEGDAVDESIKRLIEKMTFINSNGQEVTLSPAQREWMLNESNLHDVTLDNDSALQGAVSRFLNSFREDEVTWDDNGTIYIRRPDRSVVKLVIDENEGWAFTMPYEDENGRPVEVRVDGATETRDYRDSWMDELAKGNGGVSSVDDEEENAPPEQNFILDHTFSLSDSMMETFADLFGQESLPDHIALGQMWIIRNSDGTIDFFGREQLEAAANASANPQDKEFVQAIQDQATLLLESGRVTLDANRNLNYSAIITIEQSENGQNMTTIAFTQDRILPEGGQRAEKVFIVNSSGQIREMDIDLSAGEHEWIGTVDGALAEQLRAIGIDVPEGTLAMAAVLDEEGGQSVKRLLFVEGGKMIRFVVGQGEEVSVQEETETSVMVSTPTPPAINSQGQAGLAALSESFPGPGSGNDLGQPIILDASIPTEFESRFEVKDGVRVVFFGSGESVENRPEGFGMPISIEDFASIPPEIRGSVVLNSREWAYYNYNGEYKQLFRLTTEEGTEYWFIVAQINGQGRQVVQILWPAGEVAPVENAADAAARAEVESNYPPEVFQMFQEMEANGEVITWNSELSGYQRKSDGAVWYPGHGTTLEADGTYNDEELGWVNMAEGFMQSSDFVPGESGLKITLGIGVDHPFFGDLEINDYLTNGQGTRAVDGYVQGILDNYPSLAGSVIILQVMSTDVPVNFNRPDGVRGYSENYSAGVTSVGDNTYLLRINIENTDVNVSGEVAYSMAVRYGLMVGIDRIFANDGLGTDPITLRERADHAAISAVEANGERFGSDFIATFK